MAIAIAVDRVVLGSGGLDDVVPQLAIAAAAVMARSAFAAGGAISTRLAAAAVVAATRARLTERLVDAGPSFLWRHRSDELASHVVDGADRLEAYVASYLPARWLALIVPGLVALFVLLLDPPSTIVLLLTGPVLLLLLIVIGSRTRAASDRRAAELSWLRRSFLDLLRGLPTLKLFGRSREQTERLADIGRRYEEGTMDVLMSAFRTSLALEWSAAIAMALVAVEVGLRLLADAIAFERALAVLIVTPEFFVPLRRLAARYHEGSEGETSARRIGLVLDDATQAGRRASVAAPAASTTRASAEGAARAGAARRFDVAPPSIAFEGVTYTYPDRERAALDGLELRVDAGSTLALVGASGAGKSTTAAMLLRFLGPDRGRIRVDGTDLATIDETSWRRRAAWVPQRPHLFAGTVAENIAIGLGSVDDDRIEAAARAAAAWDFIERLPGGIETPLGEDAVTLSAGQRQRIAIARAVLREAAVLVMDEPVSHQDPQTEAAITDSLRRLRQGRTVLLVSHRLDLAESADTIAVLEAGRVVEVGPPVALRGGDGPYERLRRAGERPR